MSLGEGPRGEERLEQFLGLGASASVDLPQGGEELRVEVEVLSGDQQSAPRVFHLHAQGACYESRSQFGERREIALGDGLRVPGTCLVEVKGGQFYVSSLCKGAQLLVRTVRTQSQVVEAVSEPSSPTLAPEEAPAVSKSSERARTHFIPYAYGIDTEGRPTGYFFGLRLPGKEVFATGYCWRDVFIVEHGDDFYILRIEEHCQLQLTEAQGGGSVALTFYWDEGTEQRWIYVDREIEEINPRTHLGTFPMGAHMSETAADVAKLDALFDAQAVASSNESDEASRSSTLIPPEVDHQ